MSITTHAGGFLFSTQQPIDGHIQNICQGFQFNIGYVAFLSFQQRNKVKRENSSIESFVAYHSSKTIKSVEWAVGTRVIVKVYLREGYDPVVFEFEVTEYKDNFVIADKIVFEAV